MSILTLSSNGLPSPVHFMFRWTLGGVLPGLYSRISLVSICAGSKSDSTSHPPGFFGCGIVRMIASVELLHNIGCSRTLMALSYLFFAADISGSKFLVATNVALVLLWYIEHLY